MFSISQRSPRDDHRRAGRAGAGRPATMRSRAVTTRVRASRVVTSRADATPTKPTILVPRPRSSRVTRMVRLRTGSTETEETIEAENGKFVPESITEQAFSKVTDTLREEDNNAVLGNRGRLSTRSTRLECHRLQAGSQSSRKPLGCPHGRLRRRCPTISVRISSSSLVPPS